MSGTTRSGIPLRDVYTATDVAAEPAAPGIPPFTRGISPGGYNDRPWVMGQYGGFGSAAETNARFKRLLEQGQTGFSVALDLPTQLGLDSDDPFALGEVGRVGVPVDSLADFETLFDGIPLSKVKQIRTTANSIGPLWVALVTAFAEKRGTDPNDIAIFIQNDVLKEYVARGTQIFPPEAGLRMAADVVEHTAEHLPNWTPMALSGYHIRESGATAPQEVSMTLANTIAYLDEVVRRGVDIDRFASKLFMFLSAGMDLLEEIAKFRAARTAWSELLDERYHAGPGTRALQIFSYTAGSSLTAQSPHTNIVRVTIEALAAVLGGVQTLNTSSYDEALGTPTLESVTLALRTQQVLAEETSLAKVADPLGGSYLIESLTSEILTRVREDLEVIEEHGGALRCIESGYFAGRLAQQSYDDQRDVESGARRVLGVNYYADDSSVTVPAFSVDPSAEEEQRKRVAQVRSERDQRAVDAALEEVGRAARDGENCVPSITGAVRVYATVGEIYGVLRGVHGSYTPSASLG
ncbi:methylmalonyl-CoA mutase [Actinomadura sp. LD22]|uniref:Methylmalonyl-CoA mutase n=1 Tax=Actinomadura physcomitrii TaxID=2650748 RepID=A0A6I4MQJ2_9ACTN|nr:methylmalonyl-CoA mutase family protein [Actinomadura physcomitrii]MWA07005.1 methylmalonyl-CoA mutase [Actinomadura physcomitrii]